MNAIKDQVSVLVGLELFFASQKHPMFRNPHEGAAVWASEVEPFCIAVSKRRWGNRECKAQGQ